LVTHEMYLVGARGIQPSCPTQARSFTLYMHPTPEGGSELREFQG
jgi:hypothetical protein